MSQAKSLRWVILVSALLMPILSATLFSTTSFNEATQSPYGKTFIEPADYAFTIWAVIYGTSVYYGIWQFRRPWSPTDVYAKIAPFTATTFLLTSLWLVLARLNLTWLTFLCITVMLVSTAITFALYVRSGHHQVVNGLSFNLFFGWLSVAFFANLSAAIKGSGWFLSDSVEVVYTLSALLGAIGLAVFFLLRAKNSLAYGLTIIWALIAIAVSNQPIGNNRPAIVWTCIAAIGLLGVVLGWKVRRQSNLAV